MKKKLDPRILRLIKQSIARHHRSLFMIIGDRGRDQVVNLHELLAKSRVGPRPTVLWTYKKQLGFSSHQKKRMKQMKKKMSSGNYDNTATQNPFQLFLSSTQISYCYYKESHRILGQTFDVLILQDFESITPNLLCRCIQTVRGGGMIILLVNKLSSLKQIYTLSMDAHSRYKTEQFNQVQPRFNQRFILSFADCENCLVVDDEMNVLPLTSKHHNAGQQSLQEDEELLGRVTAIEDQQQNKLSKLQASSQQKSPSVAALVNNCKTSDQAQAIITLMDSIAQKTLKTTVAVTAGRGRGKSAALGLAIAGSLVFGYSNILVTAPAPQNLKTLFEFLVKGIQSLGYKQHQDYQIMRMGGEDQLKNIIVRVSIYKNNHRQTIQYIRPQDCVGQGMTLAAQMQLLVIDEAAAIPLPIVKQLLGNYLIFMSSTVNGYEGTGRSLSLKLFKTLRQNKRERGKSDFSLRTFKEIEMVEPIRYKLNDPIEKWMQKLLCLDATKASQIMHGLPHPDLTDLYFVNRDTLFSYHNASQLFLKKLISLFVSSHYKNTPDDLQLLSDAPAHGVFVLLGPLDTNQNEQQKDNSQPKVMIPDILCAIQVCYQGQISKVAYNGGVRPSGDLIPWTIADQFQNQQFTKLSGVRIVRIATHPEAQKKGYGSKAIDLLCKYYQGVMIDIDNIPADVNDGKKGEEAQNISKKQLQSQKIKARKKLPPILQKLSAKVPPTIQYIGTSYGLTEQLLNFWQRNGFKPCYLRQTPNDLTGQHSCIMIKAINNQSNYGNQQSLNIQTQSAKLKNWSELFSFQFLRRYIKLLGYDFRKFPIVLARKLIDAAQVHHHHHHENEQSHDQQAKEQTKITTISNQLRSSTTVNDLKRLQKYSKNLADYHLIMDLMPKLAQIYFLNQNDKINQDQQGLKLSPTQSTVLLGLGLQYKSLDKIQQQLNLPFHQVQAVLNKIIRKIVRVLEMTYTVQIKQQDENENGNQQNSKKQEKQKLIEKLINNKDLINKSLIDDLEEDDKTLQEEAQNKRELANLLKKNKKKENKKKIRG